MSDDRNPMFIPAPSEPVKKGCPKCGSEDYDGRRANGQVYFRCKCGNIWYGGLPQADIAQPGVHNQHATPPSAIPLVSTEQNPKDPKGPELETRRRPNLTQEFRKGAPIPDGEE